MLAGELPSDALLQVALKQDEGRSFFSDLVEPLADSFEPQACRVYREVFARALQIYGIKAAPAIPATRLRSFGVVRRVYVLSRVTLGADVAVTSVVLDAVSRRFPGAEVVFVGPRKNFDLFRMRNGLQHLRVEYARRGSMMDRLRALPEIETDDATLVIDPDSRLTQLGMLPICPPERYVFFESRSWQADSTECLTRLTASWTEAVLGLRGESFVAPERNDSVSCDVAVSFGTGGNERKRVDDALERELLARIADRGLSLVLDGGAGGPESERASALASQIPAVRLYDGPFGPFASLIAKARLYVGYDSAGGHVAAAAGTATVSIFNGFPSRRFLQRWQPCGKGKTVVVDATEQDAQKNAGAAMMDLL